jgi:hypothetical protein
MDNAYVRCHLCGELVTYDADGVTTDLSGLEHECAGSEEDDWLDDEDVSESEKADTEKFARDHDL